jgi:dihydroorotate dehydrogenase
MRQYSVIQRLAAHSSRTAKSLPGPTRRYASSTGSSAPKRFISTTLLLGGSVAFLAYYYDSRSLLHERVIMPIARQFDPETGHRLAVKLLSAPSWARPRDRGVDGPEMEAEVRIIFRYLNQCLLVIGAALWTAIGQSCRNSSRV